MVIYIVLIFKKWCSKNCFFVLPDF